MAKQQYSNIEDLVNGINEARDYASEAAVFVPGVAPVDDDYDDDAEGDYYPEPEAAQPVKKARKKAKSKKAEGGGLIDGGAAFAGIGFGVYLWYLGATSFIDSLRGLGVVSGPVELQLAIIPVLVYIGLTWVEWKYIPADPRLAFERGPITLVWALVVAFDWGGCFSGLYAELSGRTFPLLGTLAKGSEGHIATAAIGAVVVAFLAEPITRYFWGEFRSVVGW